MWLSQKWPPSRSVLTDLGRAIHDDNVAYNGETFNLHKISRSEIYGKKIRDNTVGSPINLTLPYLLFRKRGGVPSLF